MRQMPFSTKNDYTVDFEYSFHSIFRNTFSNDMKFLGILPYTQKILISINILHFR